MKPNPSNVQGQKIESHEFVHTVTHSVNWSHVLGFLILLAIVWRLGPAVAIAVGQR